jgi:uncharacterized membrane protein
MSVFKKKVSYAHDHLMTHTYMQTDEYNTLLAAQEAAIAALKDGASPNAVADAVNQVGVAEAVLSIKVLRSRNQTLALLQTTQKETKSSLI